MPFPPGHHRKGRFVAGHVRSVPIDPAVISALAPSGIGVQFAQLLWNPHRLTIRLMPDRSQRLEQALVLHPMRRSELLTQLRRILADEQNELLQHCVPVSYTHLDVYKRQPGHTPVCVLAITV